MRQYGVTMSVLAGGIPLKERVRAIKALAPGDCIRPYVGAGQAAAAGPRRWRLVALVIGNGGRRPHRPVSTSVLRKESCRAVEDHHSWLAGLVAVKRGAGCSIGAVGVSWAPRLYAKASREFQEGVFSAPMPAMRSPVSGRSAPAGIPVRALKLRSTEEFTASRSGIKSLSSSGAIEMGEAQLQIEHYWSALPRRCGQRVETVRSWPASQSAC
jgi:enoyl-[acyl-carrier protein] reductase II